MINPYRAYMGFRPFNEQEAWVLFKFAAFAEALGWTALIAAVLLRDHVLAGNGIPVTIAGRIHGTWFAVYVLTVFALAPSLGWNWLRTLIAAACSVPPYGSLIYEMWSAHRRNKRQRQYLYLLYTSSK